MSDTLITTPAEDLAGRNEAHFPHESREYRVARNALLAEEINLRRQIEQVAAPRRPDLDPLWLMLERHRLVPKREYGER